MRKPQGLIWIKGNPGSGKSVLMKYALRAMERSQPEAVITSFFFHGQGMDLQRSPLGLFRALLHSLLEPFQDKLNELTEKFNDHQRRFGNYQEKRWQWNREELEECLGKVLIHGTKNRPTILFVDALDECGDKDARYLLEYFKSVMDSAERCGSQVRICLSSRYYPILGQNNIPTVSVEINNHQDIQLVVERRLSMLEPFAECQQLQEKILSKAQGGFQWVILITQEVKERFTSEKLETLLEMVSVAPGTLDELYAGITNHASESKKQQMIRLFQWILFAKRPLAAQELREAIATEQNMTHRTMSKLRIERSWIEDLSRFEKHITDISMGLVCFQTRELWEKHSPNGEDWDREAQFIHQSAAEFARKVFIETFMDKRISQSLTGTSHFAISRSCLRYLALEEILKSPRLARGEIFSSFPLVPYIVESLFYHIREIEQEHIPQLDLLSLLGWTKGLESLAAIWTVLDPFHAKSPMGWPFVKGTVLHRLVTLGSQSAADAFIAHNDAHINAIDEYGNTPLHLSIREDQQNIALMLFNLLTEVQPHSEDHENRTSYHLNVNIENHEGETPLDIALSMGAGEVIFEFVEAGAHLQSLGRQSDLIFHAIRTGDERLFAMLLNQNVNLDGAIYFAIKEGSRTNDGNNNKIENFISELITRGANTKRFAKVTVFGEISDEEASVDEEDFESDEDAIYACLCLALRTCQIPIVLRLLAYHGQLCPGKRLHGVDKCFQHCTNKDKWLTPLILASVTGYKEAVRALFDKNLETDVREGAVLHLASKLGRDTTVRCVIELGVDVNTLDSNGSTPLHVAAKNDNTAVIRLLVAKGADVDAKDKVGLASLHHASNNNNLEAIEIMIEGGVNVEARNINNWTPLHYASQNEYSDAVEALIEGGANIDSRDDIGSTPLHLASQTNSFEAARVLIEEGANVHARDNDGWTPLHSASESDSLEAAKILIEEGANVNAMDACGLTPLHCASIDGSERVLILLIDMDAAVNACDKDGWSPLHYASHHGHTKAVQILLTSEADASICTHSGMLPLFLALNKDSTRTAVVLFEAGLSTGRNLLSSWAYLFASPRFMHEKVTKFLIEQRVDVNAVHENGLTPLLWASKNGDDNVALILINNGAHVNARAIDGSTPLTHALHNGHHQMTKLLIENGAIAHHDVRAQGICPLCWPMN